MCCRSEGGCQEEHIEPADHPYDIGVTLKRLPKFRSFHLVQSDGSQTCLTPDRRCMLCGYVLCAYITVRPNNSSGTHSAIKVPEYKAYKYMCCAN